MSNYELSPDMIWYHCEECGEEQTGPAAAVETFPTHEGTVELWFCEECARYER